MSNPGGGEEIKPPSAKLGLLNVGLAMEDKIEELNNVLNENNLDILLVTETGLLKDMAPQRSYRGV